MLAPLIGSTVCSSGKPGPRDRYPIKVIKNSTKEGRKIFHLAWSGESSKKKKKKKSMTSHREVNAGSGECSRCTYYSRCRR